MKNEVQLCRRCKTVKPLTDFSKHKHAKNGHYSICRPCHCADQKRIRLEKKAGTYETKCRKPRLTDEDRAVRKVEMAAYQRRYRADNAEKVAQLKRDRSTRVRLEGIAYYGGRCQCCGESDHRFLTLEHCDGRKKGEPTGKKGWSRAKSEGWPDRYTVLCFNCNCAKSIYGICPHQSSSV